jgi:ABC-type transport system substrate-binding protein
MLKEHWREIGVDLEIRVVEVNFWLQSAMAGTLQITAQSTGADDPFGYPDLLFPYQPNGPGAAMGPEFARWFRSNGASGMAPPPAIKRMFDLWRRGRSANLEERLAIGRELIRIHADEVLSIGLISGGLSFYGLHLASNDLGNVPRRVINSMVVRSPANALPMTFYFKRRHA